ncbi:MAG: hypothetical protein IKQ99_00005, partial [Alphaproteobacteria bacterium]|nr:hypothetical protein [Alphaproteobacteria bacterium]
MKKIASVGGNMNHLLKVFLCSVFILFFSWNVLAQEQENAKPSEETAEVEAETEEEEGEEDNDEGESGAEGEEQEEKAVEVEEIEQFRDENGNIVEKKVIHHMIIRETKPGEEEETDGPVYKYQPRKYRDYMRWKRSNPTIKESDPNPGLMGYVSPGQGSTTPTIRTPKKTWNDPLPRHISKDTITGGGSWYTVGLVDPPQNDFFDSPNSKYSIKKSSDGRVKLTAEDGTEYYANSNEVIRRKDGTFTIKPKTKPS